MPRNPYYSGPPSDHFDGLRFHAPGNGRDKSRGETLRWALRRGRRRWPRAAPSPFRDRPPRRVEGGALRVSYIGHASFLIQTAGLNLLVDPVYARRASPVAFAGPSRVNAPGVAMEDLPPLDAILVSHNHYDHLDVAALSRLARENPCRVLTPLGNDAILRRADPAIAAEAFDWGDRAALARDVAVHFLPSYHWSARGLGDRRMALWAAFVIETPDGAIYHVADTAYRDGAIFREAGARFGGFRLAILPIGAYEPRWFMADHHVDPAEAVRIFQDCGARRAIAHHWGTFQLTDEAIDAPPTALAAALDAANVAPDLFRAPRPGEATLVD